PSLPLLQQQLLADDIEVDSNCHVNLEVEDKKKKKDDRRDEKRKKKLKHLEEENLSKRLYEAREVTTLELRPPPADLLLPKVKEQESGVLEGVGVREEEERRVAIRIKLCGECGARHVAGTCPFSRPTHVLPDTCSPPTHDLPQQNGVIVAPPHRDSPVNLSGREEEREGETWRDPQRPGSPTCYARTSLPPGLSLERRVLPPPQDSSVDSDSDVGVMGVTQVPGRQVEVVVARAALTRYTQLGPVVGVPVRERDIPDDFCMVNLWEVFSGEGKRYVSTVDPRRSNWTRYLRPAPDRDSANLVVVLRPILDPSDDCTGMVVMGGV
ncbi:hypothetical protein OTU49_004254, partial [Cherax quadricarinatus]